MLVASAAYGYFGPVVQAPRCCVVMKKDVGRYMYDEPFAPPGMGREFINADGVRKPLAEFVGASEELNLAAYFGGATEFEPWDPWSFSKLSKVSANNPDVAFLREAELKHGRIAMLAFVGILVTAGDVHFGASGFVNAAAAGWPNSLGEIQKTNPGIFFQGLMAIAIVEGVSNANRGKGADVNWWGESRAFCHARAIYPPRDSDVLPTFAVPFPCAQTACGLANAPPRRARSRSLRVISVGTRSVSSQRTRQPTRSCNLRS